MHANGMALPDDPTLRGFPLNKVVVNGVMFRPLHTATPRARNCDVKIEHRNAEGGTEWHFATIRHLILYFALPAHDESRLESIGDSDDALSRSFRSELNAGDVDFVPHYVYACLQWYEMDEKLNALPEVHLPRVTLNPDSHANLEQQWMPISTFHPGNILIWPDIRRPGVMCVLDDDLQYT
jgi:hypothetical protein